MTRALAAIAALAVIACGSPRAEPQVGPYRGAELDVPLLKPDLTFIDSHGAAYPLVAKTAGKVTLLFFGFTHCPDICPVHLANIAAVLDKLPDEVQREVIVVFVTTDPARDSLPRLHAWIKGFHPEFVGLTGPDATVRLAQTTLGLVPAERGHAPTRDDYVMGHAGQVIAFTRDGMARVQYPFGTRQRDWAHDLPLLIAVERPVQETD